MNSKELLALAVLSFSTLTGCHQNKSKDEVATQTISQNKPSAFDEAAQDFYSSYHDVSEHLKGYGSCHRPIHP